MHATTDRRQFLHAVAAAGALAATAPLTLGWPPLGSGTSGMKKAVKYGMVAGNGRCWKSSNCSRSWVSTASNSTAPSTLDKDEVLKARDATGLDIPGVVDAAHWRDTLSDPDPEVRARGVSTLEAALRDAKLYGATSVLLVPAVVNKKVSYAEAYQRSQAEIRKVLPLAEQLDVKIALENVWNYFLLSPLEMAALRRRIRVAASGRAFRRRQRGAVRLAGAVDSHAGQADLQARHQGIQPRPGKETRHARRLQGEAAGRRLRLAGRDGRPARGRLQRLGRRRAGLREP